MKNAAARLASEISSLGGQTSAATVRGARPVSHPPAVHSGLLRREIVSVVFALVAAACNRPAAKMPVANAGELSQAIVEPYLSADAALASDRVDGVTANAADISSAARALGPAASSIETAAVQLKSATTLDEARTTFGVLSEAIDAYMAHQHLAPPAGVRAAFCPMAMRPWLQKDGALRNPYYGSQMLTCGSFRN